MTKPRKDTVIAGVSRCLYAAKLEGMTNDQMPGGRDIAFLSFGLRAFFVIRHSGFVISAS
jgi:hypothetical protein